MDSLYFHLNHLYTTGLRISTKDIDKSSVIDDKRSDNEYFDFELSRQYKLISSKRGEITPFDRLNGVQSTKFNIKSDTQHQQDDGTATTALDSIYHQLPMDPYNINEESINNLKHYVKDHQFDTESMDNDLR